MLEILKFKSKKKFLSSLIKSNNQGDFVGKTRHYPSASKEWYNTIYAYNKNTIKLLPVADNIVIKLIGSYFSMYNRKLEKKIKTRSLRTWMRRLSGKKIWISKPELKHTNDKIIINLFVYNRINNYLVNKVKFNLKHYFIQKSIKILEKFNIRKNNLPSNLFNYVVDFYKNKRLNYFNGIRKYNNDLLLNINYKNKTYENNLKLSYIKKVFKKEILIMYYKQYILFNNLKYKNIYILPLTKLINKIYKKKIVFNIITLKNYYLNSDILSQILSAKTRNRKNNILRVLKASIRKIKTPVINQKLIVREKTKLTGVQNFIIKDSLSKDNINKILNNFYLKKDEANISHNVLNTLKYKTVSGIRLEASGRLTRRIVAQRSVFKLKYIGSVKNIDSSYKGLSSVILRGNLKSNIQFTKLRSKTRIGAFGLKGWVSGI